MNIEQMLQDAIESKTARILKEEYGIEMSKQMIDEMSEEHDEPNKNWRYQVVLRTIGDNPERIERIINDFTHDERRTQAFMDAVPVAIHRGLTVDNEIALRNTFLTCGADAYVEKLVMEQKKYKLTEETMCFDGVTLHRIQALKDFGNVDAGELGGWVESEKNLSQSGDCWIAMEAKAYGDAEIGDNAILTRKAIACGNSTICNDTLVSDESIIRGFTYLYGDVEVYGKSVIDGDARLHGNVKVIGAKVIDAEVYDRVIICDGAYVHGRIKIDGTAYISNGAEVCKTDDYIVFKNFWGSGRHFTWTRSNNKWHVGCFRGTGEELIKKAYQDSEKSGREYERVVRYVESILADEQKEQKNETEK